MDGSTLIADVVDDPLLEGYGRFLFPITHRPPGRGDTLADVGRLLTWYSHVDVGATVDVVNDVLSRRRAGQTVFHDINNETEKASDPTLRDTGLFVFPAQGLADGRLPRVAVCCAGGGFAYVGSIHDSMPHALWLARAISSIHSHAAELGVDPTGYSLWGGSAGARLAAALGSYGPARFGGDDVPRAGAVVMQYTGLSEVTGSEPPTYACMGTADTIAPWRTMRARTDAIAAAGTAAEFHSYEGLPHGFGAEGGWIEEYDAFMQEAFATT